MALICLYSGEEPYPGILWKQDREAEGKVVMAEDKAYDKTQSY